PPWSRVASDRSARLQAAAPPEVRWWPLPVAGIRGAQASWRSPDGFIGDAQASTDLFEAYSVRQVAGSAGPARREDACSAEAIAPRRHLVRGPRHRVPRARGG